MGFLMESAEVGNIGLKQLREQREITTNPAVLIEKMIQVIQVI